MSFVRNILVTFIFLPLIASAAKQTKKQEPGSQYNLIFILTVLLIMYLIYMDPSAVYNYFVILLEYAKEKLCNAGLISGSEKIEDDDDDTSKARTCNDLDDSEREELLKMGPFPDTHNSEECDRNAEDENSSRENA